MRAAAHDPAFAKKVGIPQSVAREFEAADEAKAAPKKPRAKIAHTMVGRGMQR
jgi:hypothetical protein